MVLGFHIFFFSFFFLIELTWQVDLIVPCQLGRNRV
jgi:hypothetical protein